MIEKSKINEKVDLQNAEEEIIKFWQDNDTFKKSVDNREKPYVFFEGPPTANGRPGVHHVQSRTLKDIVCRYKTMKGFKVERKGGWDTHGLPVEIEAEKQIGINNKEDIEKYGIDKFNKKCKESVFTYKEEWEKITERTGYWVDMDKPYITMDNKYIESVWWALKEIHKKDYLSEGHKITPYCPRCGTSLSTHEVAQGYKDVKDLTVYVKMKDKKENFSYVVWTTTPWTLISNVALAMNPNDTYVQIELLDGEDKGDKLVLAEARLGLIKEEYKILTSNPGSYYEHRKYTPLFNYVELDKKAHYVTNADFVTMSDGTGIVHIAPAFGEDDYQVGRKYDLPFLQPVNEAGEYTEEVTDFKGRFVKNCDLDIMKMLHASGDLYHKEKHTHSYPHCWRCSTPLIYYGRKSWYINVTEKKQELVNNNKEVKWFPPEVGKGRFGKWLDNILDWGISRSRYWGTPLPIWISEDKTEEICIGSVEELKNEIANSIKKGAMSEDPFTDFVVGDMSKENYDKIDLHRPYVDNIILVKNGKKLFREKDVVDVWLDSGCMPFAQQHFPFENKETFKKQFPADFISEGIDQTRGWFYSLMAVSTLIFDKSPYKNVLVTELILDKNAQKMSKSKGNAVDPWSIIDKSGADALRLYMMLVSPPWVTTKFDENDIKDSVKVLKTIMNTYSFFNMYSSIDSFEYSKENRKNAEFNNFDMWILSASKTLTENVGKHLEIMDINKALKDIVYFVDDLLSNWYVRRNRRRFWKSENGTDKLGAYYTLYEVLYNLSITMAPFAPFMAERLYQLLDAKKVTGLDSVHLCDFNTISSEQSTKLESDMEFVLNVVNLGRAARSKTKIKVRQPLAELTVSVSDEMAKDAILSMKEIILDELNIKKLTIIDSSSDMLDPVVSPNFKILGRKLGKNMGKIGGIIKGYSIEQAKEILKTGKVNITVEEETFEILSDELDVKWIPKDDLVMEESNGVSIGLNKNISKELKLEGIARDLINRIQNSRKENGLDVIDRIEISLSTDSDELKNSIEFFKDYIKIETLCEKINILPNINGNELNIDDINFKLNVKKI